MDDTVRTEFGFERTVCACRECTINCRFQPGYLIPADLPRLYEATKQEDEKLEDWALRTLMASPGAIVASQGRTFRIPTLVPARQNDGSCMYLKDGRCTVHAVSPFGCAFMDAHLEGKEIDRRSAEGLRAVLVDMDAGGDYVRLWQMLARLGRHASPPEENRQKMRAAWLRETGQTKGG